MPSLNSNGVIRMGRLQINSLGSPTLHCLVKVWPTFSLRPDTPAEGLLNIFPGNSASIALQSTRVYPDFLWEARILCINNAHLPLLFSSGHPWSFFIFLPVHDTKHTRPPRKQGSPSRLINSVMFESWQPMVGSDRHLDPLMHAAKSFLARCQIFTY